MCVLMMSIFSTLCWYILFAAALFSLRVSLFCAYAILVYLLAILLAMNLFVFIVQPTCRRLRRPKEWRANNKRPSCRTAFFMPTPHTATHPLAKKKKKRVYIGRDLFCRQGKVIYISNNESDCRPGSFAPVCLRFGPGTFKFKYFRLCPDLLFQKAAIPTFPPPNFGFTPQRRTAFICLDLSTKVIKI